MQNIDTFNELVGWILGKAYETHPERLTLDPSGMPPWLRKKVSRGPEDFWDRTVLWLEREGFATFSKSRAYCGGIDGS